MDIKHTARIGVFYLEEAILEVLKEADQPLTARAIVKKLGIDHLRHGSRFVENLLHQLSERKPRNPVDNRVESEESGSTKTWWIDDDIDIFAPDWTAESFRELISEKSGEYGAGYKKRGQIESLSKLGADLMNLVESNQWKLTYKFRDRNFSFYFRHRLVFGINLHADEISRLCVWVPEGDLIDREEDWINCGIMNHRHEKYYSSGCAVYSEEVEVADIEQMLTFAYTQRSDEKRK